MSDYKNGIKENLTSLKNVALRYADTAGLGVKLTTEAANALVGNIRKNENLDPVSAAGALYELASLNIRTYYFLFSTGNSPEITDFISDRLPTDLAIILAASKLLEE